MNSYNVHICNILHDAYGDTYRGTVIIVGNRISDLNEAGCISPSTNILWKGINPTVLAFNYG